MNFQKIAAKENNTKEGSYTQKIVNAATKEDLESAFVKKVGSRGGQASITDKKTQLFSLAAIVKQKLGPNSISDFDAKIPKATTDEDLNNIACVLMGIIGMRCEEVMRLPEFDAIRDWIKIDYATSRALYG